MNTMDFGYVVISFVLLSWLLAISGVRRRWQSGGRRWVWGRFNDFPYLLVGAAPELIRRCPVIDQIRYAALGWAMLMVALLAAIGMGLSVYQFDGRKPVAVVAGTFWGLLIVVMDRLMVLAIDKYESTWKSWLKAFPRLVMVVAISMIVSHTLIQWMFASDIQREMLKMNQETSDLLNRDHRLEQAELNRRIAEINEQMKPIDAEISNLNTELAKEVRGEGASKRGDGPVAAALRETIGQAQSRKDALLAERAQAEAAVKEIDKQVAANNSAHQDVLNAPAGLLDRARAVERLIANNPHARLVNWALIMALLLVEIMPVLTKLLARVTHYDSLIQEQYERQDVVKSLRQRIYELFRQGDLNAATKFDSELLKDFWAEIERELRAGLTITNELLGVANKESTLTVYVTSPGAQTDQQRLFINFGLPKNAVLLAHFIKALTMTVESNEPYLSHWLTQGQFRVLNAQGQPVNAHQPLFAQLPDAVAFIVPTTATTF